MLIALPKWSLLKHCCIPEDDEMLFPRFQLNLNYGMHFISSNSQILESTSKVILIGYPLYYRHDDFPGFWIKLCKIVFILGRHVLKVIEMYTWGVSSISETLFWLSISGCHNTETWGFTYWPVFNTNPFRNSVLTVRWNSKVKSVYMHQACFGFHIVFKGEAPILFFLLPRPHILLQEVGQRLLPPSLWTHRLIFSHNPLLVCSFSGESFSYRA